MGYKIGDRIKVIAENGDTPHRIPIGAYATISKIYEVNDYPIQLKEFTDCLAENEIRWALKGEETLAI